MAIMKKSELFKKLYLTSRKASIIQGKEFRKHIKTALEEHPEDREIYDKIRDVLSIQSVYTHNAQLIILVEALSNIFDIESDIDLYNADFLEKLMQTIPLE